MNIPGLPIEFLVAGSSALLWLFPLLDVPFVAKESLSLGALAGLAMWASHEHSTSRFELQAYLELLAERPIEPRESAS